MSCHRFLTCSCLLLSLFADAGIVVTQNVGPGATSWPDSPLIQTVTSPASHVAVGKSFNAVGGCTNHTQTFTVNPASPPMLSSIARGGGQRSLTATGLLGPDYSLLTSTNLVNWETLFTTNSSTMPFNLSDTNRSDPLRFYVCNLDHVNETAG